MLDLILCIDDDPITLMLSKKVIAKTLFSENIITLPNGEEALNYFNKLKIDDNEKVLLPKLIFLDLNMPVMSGWEFLDIFNTPEYDEFKDIKVIILSSTIDPKDLDKAKTYPMVSDFLSKPISLSMLDYLKNKT
ncbi:response regulator [Flavobacterium sp. K5-23]|uniref:response regulator n=1 Tax=Flavobacterium sp. K5-23 TaxID=2746225 RepID=UPI00200D8A2B|nr:response regulator [Flavobacterium sp. K5-23]UQD57437.1 response regulator [Flavobacterium sp. K5-23]